MEGFKAKLVDGDISVNTQEGITHALLRELSKDESLGENFTGDFKSLGEKSKKLLLDLASQVDISNDSGAVVRKAKPYNFPWRKEAYDLVDIVHAGETISISQDRLNAVFSEFYGEQKPANDNDELMGPPIASDDMAMSIPDFSKYNGELKVVESAQESGEEKAFNLADLEAIDMGKLSENEQFQLVTQILEADTPGQTLESFLNNPEKIEIGYSSVGDVDANGIEFTLYPAALANTPNPYDSYDKIFSFIKQGKHLEQYSNTASN